MPWGAIAMAGIGAVSGIIQGNQQREAADAQNETATQMRNQRYRRDVEEWKINREQGWTDYAWQLAAVEAQRYQDRVSQFDYEQRNARIIDQALVNLDLNTQALQDQYIESERLRGIEVSLGLDNAIASQGLDLQQTLSNLSFEAADSRLRTAQGIEDIAFNRTKALDELNVDSAYRRLNIDNQAAQSNLASMKAVAGYMDQIKQQALQTNQLVAGKEKEGRDIQEQIVINESLDTIAARCRIHHSFSCRR